MALQDLTPQLRTRLSRLERVVGFFVGLATLLMAAGLAYYVFQRAKQKGTFDTKVQYYTFARSAAGLKVGQAVMLMGREVGEITDIDLQPPGDYYDVFVAFKVKEPYFGYLWEDSRVRIVASDFLGGRVLELTKGTNGAPTYLFRPFREVPLEEIESLVGSNDVRFVDEIYNSGGTNLLVKPNERLNITNVQAILAERSVTSVRLTEGSIETKKPTGIWDHEFGRYLTPDSDAKTKKGYFLLPNEAPALADRLERVVSTVEGAMPNILDLTNRLNRLIDNTYTTTERANDLLQSVRPIVNNLNKLSTDLSSGKQGALGEWLLSADLSRQISEALVSANALLTNSDARLTDVAIDIDKTLENLASITGNLHAQVKANPNLVGELSRLIVDADDMVQGLKRHWLLRSAFKNKSKEASSPSTTSRPPARSPRDMSR